MERWINAVLRQEGQERDDPEEWGMSEGARLHLVNKNTHAHICQNDPFYNSASVGVEAGGNLLAVKVR